MQVIEKTTKTRTTATRVRNANKAPAHPNGNRAPEFNADGTPIRTGMGRIADEGATPVGGDKLRDQPVALDAKMLGNNLANEVFATVRANAKNIWRGFALRIIGMPTDGRVQFLTSIKEQMRALAKASREDVTGVDKEGNPDPTGDEKKAARKRVSSATVEVSKLTTIASAWQAQATDEGAMREYTATTGRDAATVADVPYEWLVQYARQIMASKAGRTPDPWHVKVMKFFKANPASTDADKVAQAVLEEFIAKTYADDKPAADKVEPV